MIECNINTKNTISIYIHWLLNYRYYWRIRSLVSSWSFINPNLRHINHAVQTTFPYFVFCALCRLSFVMVCSSAHVSSQAAAVLCLSFARCIFAWCKPLEIMGFRAQRYHCCILFIRPFKLAISWFIICRFIFHVFFSYLAETSKYYLLL